MTSKVRHDVASAYLDSTHLGLNPSLPFSKTHVPVFAGGSKNQLPNKQVNTGISITPCYPFNGGIETEGKYFKLGKKKNWDNWTDLANEQSIHNTTHSDPDGTSEEGDRPM